MFKLLRSLACLAMLWLPHHSQAQSVAPTIQATKIAYVHFDMFTVYPLIIATAIKTGLPAQGCQRSFTLETGFDNIQSQPSLYEAALKLRPWFTRLLTPMRAANRLVLRWCETNRDRLSTSTLTPDVYQAMDDMIQMAQEANQ